MTIIRPDLSYAVGVVNQFMQTPRKPHLDAVRRIWTYIKHTLQCGIFYEAKSQLQVHGYTDADWVDNVSYRRSTSGFMFSFGNGVVSWSSKKQPTVALSSTEVEYRGVSIVACEVVWLQKLLSDLGQLVDAPIVIYCDNISSILLANNSVYHAKTKHIEVHYHFSREKVLAKEIDLIHVSTEDQIADIFTKALGTYKLKKFRKMLGVLEVDLSLRGSVEHSSSTS
jgi:histone deacetylase 1/2